MITPQQFRESWRRTEFQQLLRFPPDSISDVRIPADARAFLVEAGLPDEAAPYLSFKPPTSGTLLRVSVAWHQSAAFGRYRVIGCNGSGDPICLDEEADGQVVCLNHDNHFQRVLMASSVFTLAESLVQIRTSIAEAGGFSALIGSGRFEPLRERLRAIDPSACRDGHYWQQEFRCFTHDNVA